MAGVIPWFSHDGMAATQAQGKKRGKRPDNKRGDGNRDGKNTVDGALWELKATGIQSGKQVSFRYRASDFVLYDVATGDVIGASRKIGKSRAQVTLHKNSPFPGNFEIRFLRLSHWAGQMKRDGEEWAIKLTCLDR